MSHMKILALVSTRYILLKLYNIPSAVWVWLVTGETTLLAILRAILQINN